MGSGRAKYVHFPEASEFWGIFFLGLLSPKDILSLAGGAQPWFEANFNRRGSLNSPWLPSSSCSGVYVILNFFRPGLLFFFFPWFHKELLGVLWRDLQVELFSWRESDLSMKFGQPVPSQNRNRTLRNT